MKETCKRVDRLLKYFLEGSLSEQEKTFIEKHLMECPDCLNTEADLKEKFLEVDPPKNIKCPDSVEARVFSTIRDMKNEKAVKNKWGTLFGWKGALAGVSVAVLFLLVVHLPRPTSQSTQEYSQEEIEKARAALKWTLAYSAQTVQKKENNAIDQVFGNYIPKSVQNSARKLLPLFDGGKK